MTYFAQSDPMLPTNGWKFECDGIRPGPDPNLDRALFTAMQMIREKGFETITIEREEDAILYKITYTLIGVKGKEKCIVRLRW